MLLSRKIWGNSCSLTSGTKNAALFYLFTHKYNLVMLPKEFDLESKWDQNFKGLKWVLCQKVLWFAQFHSSKASIT